jgi:hypothetical protein
MKFGSNSLPVQLRLPKGIVFREWNAPERLGGKWAAQPERKDPLTRPPQATLAESSGPLTIRLLRKHPPFVADV